MDYSNNGHYSNIRCFLAIFASLRIAFGHYSVRFESGLPPLPNYSVRFESGLALFGSLRIMDGHYSNYSNTDPNTRIPTRILEYRPEYSNTVPNTRIIGISGFEYPLWYSNTRILPEYSNNRHIWIRLPAMVWYSNMELRCLISGRAAPPPASTSAPGLRWPHELITLGRCG